MTVESRILIALWLLVLAAGLLVTIGLPTAFSLLTDTAPAVLGAVFTER
ncbi:MAG: hypothetical protein JOZ39_08530 [Chloroflexi bacterium]|nr:hypothetical protein [Chloroflexota bacterium]